GPGAGSGSDGKNSGVSPRACTPPGPAAHQPAAWTRRRPREGSGPARGRVAVAPTWGGQKCHPRGQGPRAALPRAVRTPGTRLAPAPFLYGLDQLRRALLQHLRRVVDQPARDTDCFTGL